MKRLVLAAIFAATCLARAGAHGVGSDPTWNREISRIVYDKCAPCHRPGGTSFSLLTYGDAQPRANEIKDAVLSRRMPPWGAVKGFGSFRNDQSLTEEQIELVRRWVDSGIRRGNNPGMLPKVPAFTDAAGFTAPPVTRRISGQTTIEAPVVVEGIFPGTNAAHRSLRIVARRPDGRLEPLVWLHGYDARFPHVFLFRRPIALPSGSTILGVPADAVVGLVPAGR